MGSNISEIVLVLGKLVYEAYYGLISYLVYRNLYFPLKHINKAINFKLVKFIADYTSCWVIDNIFGKVFVFMRSRKSRVLRS